MSVLDVAKARFSVRAYTGQAVEEEKLLKILEAAQRSLHIRQQMNFVKMWQDRQSFLWHAEENF